MGGDQSSVQQGGRHSLARDGFAGPVRLFTPDQCTLIVRHWRQVRTKPTPGWKKGRAASDRLFFDVATRPAILALLKPALGENIILWGADVVERAPGAVHPWHTDIESSRGDKFVSVWIGLENTSRESALKLIPGSHRFGKPIQQVAFEHGMKRGMATAEAVCGWASQFDPEATVEQPDMSDGDALIFDGRLWHGSENAREDGKRIALLLQYACADQKILQPDFKQLEWPFRYEEKQPPVIVVAGKADGTVNRIVPPPEPNPQSRTRVGTIRKPLAFPLADNPEKGWRPHSILRGWTPNAPFMSAHISVLSPGHSPHPPHVHVEEEVLVVLDGEAEILIGDNANPDEAQVETVPAGAFSYYPAYQHHTIRNASAANVTYLMFKWYGPPAELAGQARTGIFRFSDLPSAQPQKKYHTEKFFEQPTGYLKRLHAHITVLEPGAGYPSHADKHDVAIIVLSGELRSANRTLTPHGVYYFSAGEMHGMENVGKTPARYLVFEFHSPEPSFQKGEAPSGKRNKQKQRKKKAVVTRLLENGWRWLTSPLTRKIDRAIDRRLRKYFGEEELRRARSRRKQISQG